MAKPASPAIQVSHELAANLAMAHLFQGGVAEDCVGSYDWTIIDPGGDDISFVTVGNADDPWIDRDSSNSTDRLSQAAGPSLGGADFSVAFKVHCRGTAGFGTIQGLNGSQGAYTSTSGAGWKATYFNGYTNATVLNFNQTYVLVFTYTHSGTTGRWYVDGVLDWTGSGAALTAHTITAMLSDTLGERFDGRIAFTYTWPGRVLTQGNITSLQASHYAVLALPAAANTRRHNHRRLRCG